VVVVVVAGRAVVSVVGGPAMSAPAAVVFAAEVGAVTGLAVVTALAFAAEELVAFEAGAAVFLTVRGFTAVVGVVAEM
jgi:hypothetical protein